MADVHSLVDFEAIRARHGFRLAERYVLTRSIKVTSVGEAFLADDTEAAKQVLAFVNQAPWSADSGRVAHFERRALALQSLEHANIAGLLDYGIVDDRCYAVIERFDGDRLLDKLSRKRRMSVEEALPIISQLLKALEYIHARDVVARAIDPAHVLLCSDGVHGNIVRLSGVGLAELLQNQSPPSESELIGDPTFADPQQRQGEPADPRSDVFAVGQIMLAMLQGGTPQRVPLSKRGPGARSFELPASSRVSEPLCDLIERCISVTREARPADGAALVEALIDAVPNASLFRLPRITGSHFPVDKRAAASGRFDRVAASDSAPSLSPPQPVTPEVIAAAMVSPEPAQPQRSSSLPTVAVVAMLVAAGVAAFVLWGQGDFGSRATDETEATPGPASPASVEEPAPASIVPAAPATDDIPAPPPERNREDDVELEDVAPLEDRTEEAADDGEGIDPVPEDSDVDDSDAGGRRSAKNRKHRKNRKNRRKADSSAPVEPPPPEPPAKPVVEPDPAPAETKDDPFLKPSKRKPIQSGDLLPGKGPQ